MGHIGIAHLVVRHASFDQILIGLTFSVLKHRLAYLAISIKSLIMLSADSFDITFSQHSVDFLK